jgi:hypothetical protein
VQRLVFPANDLFTYPDDVERIVRVCAEAGYEISRNDAHAAWQDYSETMCASWMILPDNDDAYIVATILNRCDVLPSESEAQK